eukprot:12269715-Alexandrium_andersonii.AAC.1
MQAAADRDYNFLEYSEDMNDSVVDEKAIRRFRALIAVLHKEQLNLSYAQQDMHKVLALVYDSAAWAKQDKRPDRQEWTGSMAKRV